MTKKANLEQIKKMLNAGQEISITIDVFEEMTKTLELHQSLLKEAREFLKHCLTLEEFECWESAEEIIKKIDEVL